MPIETIFDQPPGRLFVVRVAGNFLNEDNLGSIEFSVAVLKSGSFWSSATRNCGAVSAAVGYVSDGTDPAGLHPGVGRRKLGPAGAQRPRRPRATGSENAVAENVKLNVAAMTGRSDDHRRGRSERRIEVKGGVYDVTHRTRHVLLTAL